MVNNAGNEPGVIDGRGAAHGTIKYSGLVPSFSYSVLDQPTYTVQMEKTSQSYRREVLLPDKTCRER